MNGNLLKVKAQPDVVFFDAAGTLIHLLRPAGWHYAKAARRHGLEVDATRLEASFRKTWKTMPSRLPADGPREDDDKPWWKMLATGTLRDCIQPPAGFDEDRWFEELYTRFAEPGVWALHPDAVSCLGSLQERSRLAVISNFDGRLRRILGDLGVIHFFERLFISSEMGCEKPHPKIFRRAVRAMETEPARCLHIGDDPEKDWAAARDAGLQVFQLHRPANSLADLPG